MSWDGPGELFQECHLGMNLKGIRHTGSEIDYWILISPTHIPVMLHLINAQLYTVLSRTSAYGHSQLNCPTWVWVVTCKKELKWFNYRIAGNFQGRKLLWIGEKYNFRRENFRGLLTFAAPKDATLQISRRKLSCIAQNHEIRESFLPWKFSAIWYSHARGHPRCKVRESCIVLQSRPTWSLVAKFPQCLVVTCSMQILCCRGRTLWTRPQTGVWTFNAWFHGAQCTSQQLQPCELSGPTFKFTMQKFSMVGSYTENLEKPQSCQNWGVGAYAGVGTIR